MIDLPTDECVFCHVSPERIIDANDHAIVMLDAFPVSRGHTLVVSRRHVASFFELVESEQLAIFQLLQTARKRLEESCQPGGYNIGVNIGQHAGQTVMHVHVHLIPRYPGDVSSPEGGIRNVIPGKGSYPINSISTR